MIVCNYVLQTSKILHTQRDRIRSMGFPTLTHFQKKGTLCKPSRPQWLVKQSNAIGC